MSFISQKVSNSYNIDIVVFTQRLVKGLTETTTTKQEQQQTAVVFDVEKFFLLYQICYEHIQTSRKNREKARKMMKGMIVSKHTTNNKEGVIPDLNGDDQKEIKAFAKQYGPLMGQQQQQSTKLSLLAPTIIIPTKTLPLLSPQTPKKAPKRTAASRVEALSQLVDKKKIAV